MTRNSLLRVTGLAVGILAAACGPATPGSTDAPSRSGAPAITAAPSAPAPAVTPPTAPAPFWYRDSDGDGYGTVSDQLPSAEQPAGYVADSSDCDDSAPAVNRASAEVPGNGVDDDCDGQVD